MNLLFQRPAAVGTRKIRNAREVALRVGKKKQNKKTEANLCIYGFVYLYEVHIYLYIYTGVYDKWFIMCCSTDCDIEPYFSRRSSNHLTTVFPRQCEFSLFTSAPRATPYSSLRPQSSSSTATNYYTTCNLFRLFFTTTLIYHTLLHTRVYINACTFISIFNGYTSFPCAWPFACNPTKKFAFV